MYDILEVIYDKIDNYKTRRNFKIAFPDYNFKISEIDNNRDFLEKNLVFSYTNWTLELPFKTTYAILVDGFSYDNLHFQSSQFVRWYGDRYLILDFI